MEKVFKMDLDSAIEHGGGDYMNDVLDQVFEKEVI